MSRLTSPTAVVIGRHDPVTERDQWLSVRRSGIGGSDIPALLGQSAYMNERQLWESKILEVDNEGSEAALWGNLLEDTVAREWAARQPGEVKLSRVGTLAHVGDRWRIVNLDRRVHGCQEHHRCALEVKTRSAWKEDEWKHNAIPDAVSLQVQWAIGVTGLDAIHVAALIGGQTLESRVVTETPDLPEIIEKGRSFWHNHVLTRIPPEITNPAQAASWLSTVNPDGVLKLRSTDPVAVEVRMLLDTYTASKATGKEGDAASARLKQIIGTHEHLLIDDTPVFTWGSVTSNRFDLTRFRRDHPDLAATYTASSTTRRLTIN